MSCAFCPYRSTLNVTVQALCIQAASIYTAGKITARFRELDRHTLVSVSYLSTRFQESKSSWKLPSAWSHLLCPLLPGPGQVDSATPSISFEAHISPWSHLLPVPSLIKRAASGSAMAVAAAALDVPTGSWSLHSQCLAAISVCQSDSSGVVAVPKHDGWSGTIQAGFCRWSHECPMEVVDLRWAMMKTVQHHPPRAGYSQVGRPLGCHDVVFICQLQL